MRPISTVKLLVEWAKWGDMANIGYPSLSPMFGERCLKMPLHGIGYIPPDVFHVEQAVCRLDWSHRNALILRYQRKMTWEQMGDRFDCSWRTAKSKLYQAENECHRELQKPMDIKHQSRLYSEA